MKAMVLNEYGEVNGSILKMVDLPIPTPEPEEVLIRVQACGVCRTDIHVIERDLSPEKLPIIPGHQVVGIVEKCGTSCSQLKPGDRVGVPWLSATCGQCDFCQRGSENLCKSSRYTGYHRNGGYAEYTAAPEAYCYAIPTAFTDVEAAPLLCAGIIGYRALKRSNPPKRGKLAIFGFGSSAHITIQIALQLGLEVYVSTRGETHQALAKKLGASWVGGAYDPTPVLVESAIVFAPCGDIVPVALKSLSPGGTVSLAGIHMSPIPSMTYKEYLFHEKTLCSVEANTREDGYEFFKEASSVPIKVEAEIFNLEEANRALSKLKAGLVSGSPVLKIG